MIKRVLVNMALIKKKAIKKHLSGEVFLLHFFAFFLFPFEVSDE